MKNEGYSSPQFPWPLLRQGRQGMRVFVALLLWGLLAGYLIFNKPFAKLALGPFYVGEMVLACVLLSLLDRLAETFLEPLRRSWAWRFLAAFWLYGLLRALSGYRENGLWALRDSVTATYSIVAFAAPMVLRDLPVPGSDGDTGSSSPTASSRALREWPRNMVVRLRRLATVGALWSAFVLLGLTYPLDTKADLLALTAAVAAWLWALMAVQAIPWQRNSADSLKKITAFFMAAVLALGAVFIVQCLPTRTLWLAPGPLALLAAAAWAYTRARKKILLGVCLALVCAAAWELRGLPRFFGQLDQEYALAQDTAFSSAEREYNLRRHPDNFPPLTPPPPQADAGSEQATAERWHSLLAPDESQFETEQGRLGAHAVKWRAVFWLRCWHCVMSQAPFGGIGFGTNLTNLLRNTPAWPLYIDSQRLDPPNRSPHCAHVTILARLGLLGLALWLALLAAVLWGALKTCWHYLALAAAPATPAELAAACRLYFWDSLALLGVWLIYLWAMSFGVVLEGPMGGIWFWVLTGILAHNTHAGLGIPSNSPMALTSASGATGLTRNLSRE